MTTGAHSDDRLLQPLVGRLTELTRELLDAITPAAALERIVAAVGQVIPGADLASITLRDAAGEVHTLAQTDPVAGVLDRFQHDQGDGPAVDAIAATGPGMAFSDDLDAAAAWPLFGPEAVRRGIGSALATALLPQADQSNPPGTLNVYSRRRGALTAHDGDIALLLATHASLALAGTQAVTTAELQVEHLRRAIASRDVIGQAKGILMQRRGINGEEAFDVLRRISQNLNVKLADLAQVLSERHTELQPDFQELIDGVE
jgi:GAF domain-containing protein